MYFHVFIVPSKKIVSGEILPEKSPDTRDMGQFFSNHNGTNSTVILVLYFYIYKSIYFKHYASSTIFKI